VRSATISGVSLERTMPVARLTEEPGTSPRAALTDRILRTLPGPRIAGMVAWRCEQTLEWPIDERAIALMTVVVTGVVTSLAVRLVFLAANL
jgi:hypothetical protein